MTKEKEDQRINCRRTKGCGKEKKSRKEGTENEKGRTRNIIEKRRKKEEKPTQSKRKVVRERIRKSFHGNTKRRKRNREKKKHHSSKTSRERIFNLSIKKHKCE